MNNDIYNSNYIIFIALLQNFYGRHSQVISIKMYPKRRKDGKNSSLTRL